MEAADVVLGELLKDVVSNFEGIAVNKTEWLNGDVRVTLQGRELQNGIPVAPLTFDVELLAYVGPGLKETVKKRRAGFDASIQGSWR